MAKFKMKLKLQGLEVEMEGEREDIPLLTQNLSAQIAGQLMPAANIAAAKLPPATGRAAIDGEAVTSTERVTSARRRSSRRSNGGTGGSTEGASVIAWQHDPNAWGNPMQTWKGTDKAIWLLYVAKQVGAAAEMTSHQIATTFDKLFRSAKAPTRPNLIRDLGKLASQAAAKVGSNGTVEPPTWFLTDVGIKHAEGLVKAARGVATETE